MQIACSKQDIYTFKKKSKILLNEDKNSSAWISASEKDTLNVNILNKSQFIRVFKYMLYRKKIIFIRCLQDIYTHTHTHSNMYIQIYIFEYIRQPYDGHTN